MNKKKTERVFTRVDSLKHFSEKITEFGEKSAFLWHDAAHQPHEMSYTELSAKIKTLAAGFASLGFKENKIAIIGETSPFWVATYVAAIASGNVAIPMDKELQIDEIEGFLEFAEADAIVFSAGFNEKFAHAVESHPTIKYFIPIAVDSCPYANDEKVLSFEELLARGEKNLAAGYALSDPENLERMSVMLFTSGTTGTSKCVMLSEKNVVSAMNAACNCVEFFPDDTIVSCLPIHHTYELCCLLSGLNYGMNVGINDSLKRVIRNFQEYKPTGLVLVPLFVTTMYRKIWDEAKKKKKDKLLRAMMKVSHGMRKVGLDARRVFFKDVLAAFGGRLCKIVCGAAPLNPDMVEAFEEFGILISEGYGITECSPLVSVNPYFAPKRGSVGPAVDCCEVLIDAERVNDLGYNEGEILVKGDNVMLGYYKNPEATAAAFTVDGYFRTGDSGYMDEDGYIYITGRKKSVIVLENGKNVFPEEIEEYLSRLETVGESVVVGRKKEDSDTIILTALIYPNPARFPEGTDEAEIAEAVRAEVNTMNKQLVGYKQVRAVEIRRTEFEKTTTRKIKRHLVK